MLRRLAYSSTAQTGLEVDDLEDIIASCLKKNVENEITGVLVYTGESFIQILEGTEESLQEVMGRIIKDGRHDDLEVLLSYEITQRSFTKWSMGFLEMNEFMDEDIIGLSNYQDIVDSLTGTLDQQDSFIKSCLKILEGKA